MKDQMIKVTVNGTESTYPRGTSFQTIAADFQENYPYDILLVNRNGKLCELSQTLDRECTLTMVTAAEKPGIQTYERSATFLMLKAFHDVAGRENIERITVEFSISHALFIRARGNFTPDTALLHQVEDRMRELAAQALPIEKHSVDIDQAAELFRNAHMEDKARLLQYRNSSQVNKIGRAHV